MSENNMGTQKISRLVLTTGIPLMLSLLINSLYNFVDSVFVSRVAEDALTALSLAAPVQMMVSALGLGNAVGLNAAISRALGEGRPDKVKKTVFTGQIDQFFDYKLGVLEYRSVRFETEVLDTDNYQGNAVVNYTERSVPYTRIIEHKHFEFGTQPKTVISREYSSEWKPGIEPYYPVNNDKNNKLYEEYKKLADETPDVIFGGRLGHYKYYDMDKVIDVALAAVKEEFGD